MSRGSLQLAVALVAASWTFPLLTEAQSLNIDFGVQPGPGPAYSAAGEAGYWNAIAGVQGISYSLLGLDGQPSGVTVFNIGGTEIVIANNPETSGSEHRLLDDYLVTFNPGLETCLFFDGLENGTYQVITYAWVPGDPPGFSYVTVDQSASGGEVVGGQWPGMLQELVTHSIHYAEVTNGSLCAHSGLVTGFPQAALNGVQLILEPPAPAPLFVRGDVTGDAVLALDDAVTLLAILFAGAGPAICDDALDANDDGLLALGDPIALLNLLFASGAPLPPPQSCGEDPTADALECETVPGC